jgi:hypothetical protein
MEAILDTLKQPPKRINLNIDLIDKTSESPTETFDYDQIIKEIVKPDKSNKANESKKPNMFDDSVEEDDVDSPIISEFSDIIEWKNNFIKTDIHLKTSDYYLSNREFFSTFINNLLSKYNKELLKDTSSNKDYFNHQKLLQKYLNAYSPYRGLLLYHGLGTGKTCSSIGIAEGLKHTSKIIILTPASLQKNYIKELKMCGDPLFKFNQYWLFKSLDKYPDLIKIASKISLTEECVKKNNGIWFADIKKGTSNYDQLSSEQQKNLDHQITTMIKSKYIFINYNGLRLQKWKDYTKKNNNVNLFNNKVVIIDESHNFVSRIINKLKNPKSLSMQLYHDLMNAENCRIVLLTGTPVINYPNEISVMFNILRGYIKSFTVNLTPPKNLDMKDIIAILKKNKVTKSLFDYVEYKPTANTLLLTKNPFGFINRFHGSYKGINKDLKHTTYKNLKYSVEDDSKSFINEVKKVLQKHKIKVNDIKNNNNYKCLPDSLEEFNSKFIDNIFNIKNELLLKRRILGLTSFFENIDKSLMPEFDKENDIIIQHIKMSKYQFNQYNIIRAEERKQEKNNKKNKMKKKNNNNIYEDTVSTYRIFSRAACNFVFPDKFPRPKPNKQQNLNEDNLDIVSAKEKLSENSEYENDDKKQLLEEEKKEVSYNDNLQKALTFLEENPNDYLKASPDSNESTGLNMYSPKFLRILQNLQNADYHGLHLLYSQFRTLEGIGIFKLVLEANGFEEFKLIKQSDGTWDFDIKEMDKPRFVLYTGTEDQEQKELIRNIYNSRWDILPTYLIEKLEAINKNNFFGEIIKLFMITSSGAEGIDLKNTRYVHIMEPYWHPVRTSQVIGRANRLNSHIDLPEKYRTVKVFQYIMYISKDDLKLDDAIELIINDIGKLTNVSDIVSKDNPEAKIKQTINQKIKLYETLISGKKKPLTTDETLYEISAIKDIVNQSLLKIIKEAAIDCNIHSKHNKNITCYSSLSSSDKNAFVGKLSIEDEDSDNIIKKNIVTVDFKGIKITLKKQPYILKIDSNNKQYVESKPRKTKLLTGELYDVDSIKEQNPLLVANLVIKDGKQQINFV